MNSDARLEYNGHKTLVDVVQDLAVYLERTDDLLVRVMEGQASKVGRNFAPSCIRAPSVRGAEKDDQLRALSA